MNSEKPDEFFKDNNYYQDKKEAARVSLPADKKKRIQVVLQKAGFYKGKIDGKIGPKTKEAILKFQKANGLKADGIVGKKTSAALDKYLSR